MRAIPNSTGGVLSAAEVKIRKAKSMSDDICFISLVPLTDETRFTVIGPNEQYNIHNKFGVSVMESMNK